MSVRSSRANLCAALFSIALSFCVHVSAGSPTYPAFVQQGGSYWVPLCLGIEVSPSGHAKLVDPSTITPTALRERIQATVETWQFEPALVLGKPVVARTGLYLLLQLATDEQQTTRVWLRGAKVGPQLKKRVVPYYPTDDVRSEREGDVLLNLKISRFGGVNYVKVVASTASKRMEQAAIDAAHHWEFIPDRVAGKVAPDQWVAVPVEFRIPRLARAEPPDLAATLLADSSSVTRLITDAVDSLL